MEHTPFPQQRVAIEAPPGPVLVLAGPGAGKTFCLIRRVEHLVCTRGFTPERICAVTFTNKAAEELTQRLNVRLGARAEDITRGTLHSLCLSVLRNHGERVGLRPGFGVADEAYQRLILRRLQVYPDKRRRNLLNLFGRHRLAGYELTEGDAAYFDSYRSMLREKNVVDFDDIIAYTAELFDREPKVSESVRERWDCLLVDEFQDLDATQYRIVKRLAEGHRNLFAVGDDEQSIFSWRGGDPRILWRVRTDFEIEDPVILDRNCRCSHQIFTTARRLLSANPTLFDKGPIEAERDSEHDVVAYGFPDETREADWLVSDLQADRAETGRPWGDYALLYRTHRIGAYLEDRLVGAGIPCRLARGHALLDDDVIAYVVISLRLMSAPDDPVPLEAFAERMLPRSLMAELRTLASSRDQTFFEALRHYAMTRPNSHPDTKKAWRFVYHVENLRALYRSHESLSGLIEGLLSERVRRYGNVLEERYDELTDPAIYPGARELAQALRRALSEGGKVWVRPASGTGIALRGMLHSVDLPVGVDYLARGTSPGPADLELDGGPGSVTTLFKALQLIHAEEYREVFRDYVTFDLETTDLNSSECDIVEIGAARVRDGAVTETFRSLVRPGRRISERAREIHGYTDSDVADAPPLQEVWPRFREFVADDVLVVHNGHNFDIPVLRRAVSAFGSADDLVFFDTLPVARSLFHESAKLEHLARRFELDQGRAHHALDDAVTLARVFQALNRVKIVRARTAALANLLDFVGLGLALEDEREGSDEEELLLEIARPYALGRYSDALEFYAAQREMLPGAEIPTLDEVIERLGGEKLMQRIRREKPAEERYPAALARLQSLIDHSQGPTLEESIRRLLERVVLSTSEGVEAEPYRVNLLTLHATKGLEFSRVYVVGAEDYELPGYHATEHDRQEEIQESRRLLYVGMTRAEDRLVLTRAEHRFGRPSGGHRFLDEMGCPPVSP